MWRFLRQIRFLEIQVIIPGRSGSAVILAEIDHELMLHFQAGVLASITASEEKEAKI